MQGFCVPPELMEDTKGGEEFVDQEAGGFDEGEGANDVSENIDRNNLVSENSIIIINIV